MFKAGCEAGEQRTGSDMRAPSLGDGVPTLMPEGNSC